MWAESDLYPGVPCLQSTTEPVNGNVYRMYHGTTERAAEQIKIHGFKQSADGMLGRGVYLSRDLNKASRYPLDKPHERVVIRVKVNVGRVKKIDCQGHSLQNTWHDHGYDTAWCPPNCGMVPSGLEEDCVWDPQRITVIDIIPPSLQSSDNPVEGLNMWAESDLYPGVPCLQSTTEPVNGNVYRMYHGTTKRAAEQIKIHGFKPSANGMLGRGVYLSRDLNKARRYPLNLPEDQRAVIRVKVNVGRVKKIDYQGHPLQRTWHENGYDTAWCPPNCGMVPSGLEEDCVWDPQRITIIDVIPVSPQSSDNPVEGKVYTMFYGTTKEDAEKIKMYGFCQSDGMLGRGVYLSRDVEKASKYPMHVPEQQKSVLRVKVNVGKVIKIDRQSQPMQKTWHENGYDTAWCPPNCRMVPSGLEQHCVWNQKAITVIDVIRPI